MKGTDPPAKRSDTALAERLRALGLVEDTSEGAPLCRWRHGHMIIDVLPTDASVLGFSNRSYRGAIETAETYRIAGHAVRIVTPAFFVATKLEAFHGRGGDDVFTSHDLEDIVAVVDGRPQIVDDVAEAAADVRAHIASEMRALLDDRDFIEALSGFLLPDPASQARRAVGDFASGLVVRGSAVGLRDELIASRARVSADESGKQEVPRVLEHLPSGIGEPP